MLVSQRCQVLAVSALMCLATSAHAQTNFSGFTHSSIGNATLRTETDGTLTVSNIGSSGQDGVAIDLGGNTTGGGFRVGGFGHDLAKENININPLAKPLAGIPQPIGNLTFDGIGSSAYDLFVSPGSKVNILGADGQTLATPAIDQATGRFGRITLPDLPDVPFNVSASRDVLKTYFETGDVPTESQFTNIFDSTFSGVFGLEVAFGSGLGTTDISDIEVRYTAPAGSPVTRTHKKAFARKIGDFASAAPGGVSYAGLGNAQISTGDTLVVSNIGSSGEDGVSFSLGEATLEGGKVSNNAKVRVEKFNVRQEYGQQQGSRYRTSVSPGHIEAATEAVSPLFEGIVAPGGGTGSGIGSSAYDLFFDSGGFLDNNFTVVAEQQGNPLVNEVVIGLQDKRAAVSFDALTNSVLADISFALDDTGTNHEFTFTATGIAAFLLGETGPLINTDPNLPTTFRIQATSQTPLEELGVLNATYAGTGDVVIESISAEVSVVPEPSSMVLVGLAFLALGGLVRLR